MDRVVVVIPAFRPDDTLPDILTTLLALDVDRVVDHVVVVDDGSGPECRGTCARVATLPRVSLVSRDTNTGKGAALKGAISAIVHDNQPNIAGIVTADADGQHAPADILRVARAVVERRDCLVLGVRRFGRGVPLRSRFGNVLTRSLVRWRTGVAIQDTQTGLRGWPLAWCEELLRVPGDRYEWELLALLTFVRRCIVQIPVETIYGCSSHFRPVRDSMRIYRAAARRLLS